MGPCKGMRGVSKTPCVLVWSYMSLKSPPGDQADYYACFILDEDKSSYAKLRSYFNERVTRERLEAQGGLQLPFEIRKSKVVDDRLTQMLWLPDARMNLGLTVRISGVRMISRSSRDQYNTSFYLCAVFHNNTVLTHLHPVHHLQVPCAAEHLTITAVNFQGIQDNRGLVPPRIRLQLLQAFEGLDKHISLMDGSMGIGSMPRTLTSVFSSMGLANQAGTDLKRDVVEFCVLPQMLKCMRDLGVVLLLREFDFLWVLKKMLPGVATAAQHSPHCPHAKEWKADLDRRWRKAMEDEVEELAAAIEGR